MQTIAVAVAISLAIGGAVGAGATSLVLSFKVDSTAVCPPGGSTQAQPYQPVPTTGSKGF